MFPRKKLKSSPNDYFCIKRLKIYVYLHKGLKKNHIPRLNKTLSTGFSSFITSIPVDLATRWLNFALMGLTHLEHIFPCLDTPTTSWRNNLSNLINSFMAPAHNFFNVRLYILHTIILISFLCPLPYEYKKSPKLFNLIGIHIFCLIIYIIQYRTSIYLVTLLNLGKGRLYKLAFHIYHRLNIVVLTPI